MTTSTETATMRYRQKKLACFKEYHASKLSRWAKESNFPCRVLLHLPDGT